MKVLQRIRRLRRRDGVLLARALGAVLRVRLHLLRNAHHDLRRLIESYPLLLSGSAEAPRADLAEVAWSVRNAARLVPGATCLTQASAGQLLLARRGYGTTIRLSVPVRAAASGTLAPHAWLMAGDTIVMGGTVAEYLCHQALHDFTLPGTPRT